MSWETPVPIFEDEDEDALKSKFVEMSAAYPQYSPIAIANYIFQELKDPTLRANQAALKWSNDLAILVRIDKAKLNGNKEAKPIETKEEKLRKIEAMYNDMELSARDRLAAFKLHCEIQGELVKPTDTPDGEGGTTNNFPTIIYAVAEQSKTQQAA